MARAVAPAAGVTPADALPDYGLRLAALGVILLFVLIGSVCVGRFFIAPADVVTGMLSGLPGFSGLASGMPADALTAIWQVRFPRIATGAAVGLALSVAGAAYQGLFQNPMVSQDVLGASSGAAFGAATGLLLTSGVSGPLAAWLPASLDPQIVTALSFACGLAATLISLAVSRISPASPILSLILAGMVVSSLFSSGTSAVKLIADTESTLPAITYWLMGSLASARPEGVTGTCLAVLAGTLPIFLLRWRINLLACGEEEAKGMGLDTGRVRTVVIVCATFLTASCISVSGMIGWVGLVIPHFCRLVFGYDYRRLIPAAMLMGPAFLVLVDDIARTAATSEIPIGILTSVVGAPVFIYLIARGGGARGPRRY